MMKRDCAAILLELLKQFHKYLLHQIFLCSPARKFSPDNAVNEGRQKLHQGTGRVLIAGSDQGQAIGNIESRVTHIVRLAWDQLGWRGKPEASTLTERSKQNPSPPPPTPPGHRELLQTASRPIDGPKAQ